MLLGEVIHWLKTHLRLGFHRGENSAGDVRLMEKKIYFVGWASASRLECTSESSLQMTGLTFRSCRRASRFCISEMLPVMPGCWPGGHSLSREGPEGLSAHQPASLGSEEQGVGWARSRAGSGEDEVRGGGQSLPSPAITDTMLGTHGPGDWGRHPHSQVTLRAPPVAGFLGHGTHRVRKSGWAATSVSAGQPGRNDSLKKGPHSSFGPVRPCGCLHS